MTFGRPIGVIGMGQLGGVFSHGLLRLGRAVVPVIRGSSPEQLASIDPELVLVTVGEDDLGAVLEAIPRTLKRRVILVQNELVPSVWQARGIIEPTVVVVWFEKKAERGVHTVLPTEITGPAAELLSDTLSELAIPNQVIPEVELPIALARKNLYILTLNLAGLRFDTNAADLWYEHSDFAMGLATELIKLQGTLLGSTLNETALLTALKHAIDADPSHGCRGRSAPARLARARSQAAAHGLDLPLLASLSATHP